MKKLLLLSIVLIVGCVFAQQYKDVIILKNGSEIHGIIIEEKPYEYIKIQSGENTFVFQFDEIELLKKELITEDLTANDLSLAVGYGTNRGLTIFGFSRDFRLGNHFSVFLTLGLGILPAIFILHLYW